MKKRRVILVSVSIAVAGGLAWLFLAAVREKPEPVYQGKRLSKWLENYTPDNNGVRMREKAEADEAIRAIGTNAIPTLLKYLRTPDSGWRVRLAELARKYQLVKSNYTKPNILYNRAIFGFEALGPAAESATPGLIRIYNANISWGSQLEATGALAAIGPGAKAAVPHLIRNLGTTNILTRSSSLMALGKIHSDADVSVPALIKALGDKDQATQAAALQALGEFGAEARTAVPVVVKFIEENPPAAPESEFTGYYSPVFSPLLLARSPNQPAFNLGDVALSVLRKIDRKTYNEVRDKIKGPPQ